MTKPVECPDCGTENDLDEIRDESRSQHYDGKTELNCTECGKWLTIEFYCGDCDVWHGGRVALKRYDNGSVAKYVCPDCDGWFTKGNVLDVKQGPHR